MANLQVRDIDDRLYESLKRRSDREHRSISQEVVRILENSLASDTMRAQTQTREFLELTGAWSGKATAKQLIGDIRASRTRNSREKIVNELFD